MNIIADAVHDVLLPFLVVTGSLLVLLVVHVLLLHCVRDLAGRRRQRLLARYRPLIAAALQGEATPSNLQAVQSVPRRHRTLLGHLLLEPLRSVKGTMVVRAQGVAAALGLVATWEADLRHPRWWTRAEAAHALGLLRYPGATQSLVRALEDTVEDVRAAAVEALGRIGDPAALPALVARLSDGSRHQRVRLVEALQQFGGASIGAILEHARAHPEDLAIIAELIGSIEAPSAIGPLLEWCADARAEVRTAAVRALGAIGADDRTYYHLLRALTDEAPEVRAAAAWALGRSGRADAAGYLAPRLRDEWIVAVQTARALRALGTPGCRVLESAAAREDGELARQMLWESHAAAGS